MSADLTPWDCPFCGRASAEEPTVKRTPRSHTIDSFSTSGPSRLHYVLCWHCGARGPLSGSPREALARWMYRANRSGAPKW